MADINQNILDSVLKILELSLDLRNTRLDQILARLTHIERRQHFVVEALKALLRGQTDEATIAALTQKLVASASSLESSVEANVPQS